jgi:hypothetical protein
MTDDAELDVHDDPDVLEKKARKQVRSERDFYVHLATYLMVNGMLVALNLVTSPEYLWAVWPILGWGIGLGSHFIETFGLFGMFNQEWQERKVREYMLRRQHGLTAPQVKQLMHDELQSGLRTHDHTVERLVTRIEHLEAIVTSFDWDQVESRAPHQTLDESPDSLPEETSEERARRLANRVR